MAKELQWLHELQRTSVQVVDMIASFTKTPRTPTQEPDLVPSYDIVLQTEAVVIHLELPGVRKDDIILTMEGQSIIVAGVKRIIVDPSDEVAFSSRQEGPFEYRLTLPTGVDVRALEGGAVFNDGILTISIPRAVKLTHSIAIG